MRILRERSTRVFPPDAGRAFTLPELMVAMSIFLMVIAAVIAGHIFGLRMFELTRMRLVANDHSWRVLRPMIEEIRSAETVEVGNGDDLGFTANGTGEGRVGNAIELRFPESPGARILYFRDDNDSTLKRLVEPGAQLSTVAHFVGNSNVFSAEDFSGAILTNRRNSAVIAVTVQYDRFPDPPLEIGAGQQYGRYHMETRISRRPLQ